MVFWPLLSMVLDQTKVTRPDDASATTAEMNFQSFAAEASQGFGTIPDTPESGSDRSPVAASCAWFLRSFGTANAKSARRCIPGQPLPTGNGCIGARDCDYTNLALDPTAVHRWRKFLLWTIFQIALGAISWTRSWHEPGHIKKLASSAVSQEWRW